MNTVTGITSDPSQEVPITLPDGSTLTLTLRYSAQQSCWFYDATWDGATPTWQLLGMRLVTHPNLWRQYRNQIPFGLTVSTPDNADPTGPQDFVNGLVTLFVLDAADVATVESTFFGGLA